MFVEGLWLKFFVDTGCQQTVIFMKALDSLNIRYIGKHMTAFMSDGNTAEYLGKVTTVAGMTVSNWLVSGCSVIFGMDAITSLGKLAWNAMRVLKFRKNNYSKLAVAAVVNTEQTRVKVNVINFLASFDVTKWAIKGK